MLPDLSIRQLEYLVAVDEAGTWAQAAAAVGVTPSALSQGLAELERRLGVALFDRESRPRQLLPAAATVVAHARQVLGLTADLTRWADRLRRGAAGRVRLGMIDAAAVVHFPDAVQAFRADHPDVELLVRVAPSGALLKLLVGGQLDVAVCVAPPRELPGVAMRRVRTERMAVYAPPGRRIGPPSTWGPWVLYPAGSHTRHVVVSELRRLGAPIDIVAESHQPEVLREMVRFGTGWTVLPSPQAEAGPRGLSRGRTLATRHLVLATRASGMREPAVEALVQRLTEHRGSVDGPQRQSGPR